MTCPGCDPSGPSVCEWESLCLDCRTDLDAEERATLFAWALTQLTLEGDEHAQWWALTAQVIDA